jgi:hypothetical protein
VGTRSLTLVAGYFRTGASLFPVTSFPAQAQRREFEELGATTGLRSAILAARQINTAMSRWRV